METQIKKPNILPSVIITIIVFILSILVLSFLNLTPDFFQVTPQSPFVENSEEILNIESDDYTRPDRIIIEKVGIDTVINQPEIQDVAVLDQALLGGAVHYPGSGSVERGNMFIFGHSTNWQVVRNQAFKTFNGLEKLEKGDQILVVADENEYIYRVDSVKLVDEDDALVVFDSSGRTLTLSTCNTFGQKQERWVVEASLD